MRLSRIISPAWRSPRPAIESIGRLLRSTIEIIQRQEHGGQKEGHPLMWQIDVRVVFDVAAVTYEFVATIEEAHSGSATAIREQLPPQPEMAADTSGKRNRGRQRLLVSERGGTSVLDLSSSRWLGSSRPSWSGRPAIPNESPQSPRVLSAPWLSSATSPFGIFWRLGRG